MIFHKTHFGMHGTGFKYDLSGFVATTARETLRLEWPEPITKAEATAIAAHNRKSLTLASRAIREWRGA